MHIRDREEEVNRDRGILTPEDRAFLLGAKEMREDSERRARQRIRERTKNAIRDFWFLRALGKNDRDLIAEDLFQEGPLWQGYVDMFAFFWRLNQEWGANMESEIRVGVERGEDDLEKETGETVEVRVNFDVEREVVHTHDDLREKFRNNEPMTPEEAQTLFIESDHYDHLNRAERWEKFRDFLNDETEASCIIEEDEDFTPHL